MQVAFVFQLAELGVGRGLTAHLRLAIHRDGDLVVVSVVLAFGGQNLGFVKAALFHQSVEFLNVFGQAVLRVKFALAFLADVFVDALVLAFDRQTGAVDREEVVRIDDRDVKVLDEERFERGVERGGFDFGA